MRSSCVGQARRLRGPSPVGRCGLNARRVNGEMRGGGRKSRQLRCVGVREARHRAGSRRRARSRRRNAAKRRTVSRAGARSVGHRRPALCVPETRRDQQLVAKAPLCTAVTPACVGSQQQLATDRWARTSLQRFAAYSARPRIAPPVLENDVQTRRRAADLNKYASGGLRPRQQHCATSQVAAHYII